MTRVMIVEDEFYVRQGIVNSVPWAENGFAVVGEAENGEEALEKLPALMPDLLLVDIRMPVMDGLSLLAALYGREGAPGVVMLTSYSDFTYAQQALRLGALDFVLKLSARPEDIVSACRRARERMRPEEGTGLGQLAPDTLASLPGGFVACLQAPAGKPLPEGFSRAAQKAAQEALSGTQHAMLLCGEAQLLLHLRTNAQAQALKCCHRLLYHLAQEGFAPLACGLSGHGAPGGLERCWAQACAAADSAFYRGFGVPLAEGDTAKHADEAADPLTTRLAREMGAPRARIVALAVELLFDAARPLRERGMSLDPAIWSLDALYLRMNACLQYEDVQRETADLMRSLRVLEDGAPARQRAIIAQLRAHIDKCYSQDLSLEQLSRDMGLSYCYLSSLFKAETGRTLTDYIADVRVQRAKELLAEGRLSVAQVSEAVGYPDANYFSRVFKKCAGVSPMEYRSSARHA